MITCIDIMTDEEKEMTVGDIKTTVGKESGKLRDLLHTIYNETEPIRVHRDPGAVEDCWRTVWETLDKNIEEIEEYVPPTDEVKGLTDEELEKELEEILYGDEPLGYNIDMVEAIEEEMMERELFEECVGCGKELPKFEVIMGQGICRDCIEKATKEGT